MNEKLVASASELTHIVTDAHTRTLALVADLTDEQWMGPHLPIVNPLLWEIGHVTWFNEKWVLRDLGKERPIREDGDRLYNSAQVPHDTRWDLPLPSREETVRYKEQVLERILERLGSIDPSEEETYFHRLIVFHEDMHAEAFTYVRQTLGYPRPHFSDLPKETHVGQAGGGPLPGDVEVPGGTFHLGGTPDLAFVFDNEKWTHPVKIQPFRIARAPVTNLEYTAFAEDKGYRRREFWSDEGWRWREEVGAEHPVYWHREPGGRWYRRHFDELVPLEDHHPVVQVNWYESEAYCRWAGRRLPTEAEWEVAASVAPSPDGREITNEKRRFPWGYEPLSAHHANLGWRIIGCIDVAALPAGDSAFGCRQMIGNMWEWTNSTFGPYPGFVVDPYKEYSEPFFGTRKVLRGGSWAIPSRLIRNTWRNFFAPDRRDIVAGFRTCAK